MKLKRRGYGKLQLQLTNCRIPRIDPNKAESTHSIKEHLSHWREEFFVVEDLYNKGLLLDWRDEPFDALSGFGESG
jgi:hypothetical protein